MIGEWRKYLNPVEAFRLQPSTAVGDASAELDQSHVRFAIVGIFFVYMMSYSYFVESNVDVPIWVWKINIVISQYLIACSIIYCFARRFPGHYPIRRIIVIALDNVAIAYSIVCNPVGLLPLYAVLVWIVVGNGLRYGKFYLILAMLATQTALIYVYFYPIPPVIEANVAITLSLTVLVVPFYALALLGRVDRARQHAEELSASKSRFLAQASHDLRQPLHATSLVLGNLASSNLQSDQKVMVESVQRSLGGVSDLFRSLLDLSMLDSGRLAPRFKPFHLGELLDEVLAENAAMADWASAEVRLASTRRAVNSDRILLKSMVQNLLSNAIKYSDGKAVLLGTRTHGNSIAIEVWDRGPGISHDVLPNVFDEFYQARKLGDPDRKGVGLGLSIVQRMANLLGLSVDIRSRVGRGTCVAISGLDVVVLQDVPPLSKSSNVAEGFASPLEGLRILLVEDDKDTLDATAMMLARWGCIVESHHVTAGVANPEIERLTNTECVICGWAPDEGEPHFDLLVTDFDLGQGRTGADCIAAFRDTVGPAAPVVVITGHDSEKIWEAIAADGVTVLKKPVSPAELRSVLGSISLAVPLRALTVD
ncbi:MAG: response regulator [Sphingopyxis sp.]|nr:response regulator [Sphingopyxis sp.]